MWWALKHPATSLYSKYYSSSSFVFRLCSTPLTQVYGNLLYTFAFISYSIAEEIHDDAHRQTLETFNRLPARKIRLKPRRKKIVSWSSSTADPAFWWEMFWANQRISLSSVMSNMILFSAKVHKWIPLSSEQFDTFWYQWVLLSSK